MTVKEQLQRALPRVSENEVVLYSFLFVLLQVVFLCIQANPSSLQHRNRLSAVKVYGFAAAVAIGVAALLKASSRVLA